MAWHGQARQSSAEFGSQVRPAEQTMPCLMPEHHELRHCMTTHMPPFTHLWCRRRHNLSLACAARPAGIANAEWLCWVRLLVAQAVTRALSTRPTRTLRLGNVAQSALPARLAHTLVHDFVDCARSYCLACCHRGRTHCINLALAVSVADEAVSSCRARRCWRSCGRR